ncbi:nucleoporin autopeptidase-domain-containing protein [Lactarius akahatsu]|uniref:Nucleoporin autopeptidase-domain-containing protein n=1 Tax=Lactarius akahatsu TaxID=416441 RepID=A0AAD4LQP6_9AGAM|nr:nucleoporin autopeptidase-domain-containing protein [Lactarius akahatsu]
MFSNTGIQSTWSSQQPNPQQPQQPQQPQTGSVFGQPSAFGAGGGVFGSGPGFGQTPQQQPQQANSMFGNLASNPNPTPAAGGSTFGAFGGGTANPSMFGATKPATGFGAFGGGGASAFGGGGGAFGAAGPSQPAASNTNLFGQPSTSATGGAFGAGTFGGKPATSAFGATATNSNAGTYDGAPPVTTGTVNPPYSVFSEKDSANASVTLQYQSITCMPQYRGNSFEELRMQDYQQNRKTAGANAFGQSAFGGTTQPSAAPSLFGQPAQQQPPANPIFGSFGNTAANSANTGTGNAFSGLGQNPAQPTPTGGFGTFNQPPQQPATTGFGTFAQPQQQQQQQQQPQQQQQQQQQQSAGLFGNAGAFGSQNKPPGGFGNPSGFGGTTNTGSTGLFGQTNTAQQPAASTGLFGQSQPASNTFGGGAFGASAAGQKPSIFAQTTQQQPPAGGGFGLFGSQQQQQQQQQNPQSQQSATGAFGNQPAFGQTNTTQPQQGGLFGSTQTQQPATGLFGNSGGLFGNTQQQGAQQQGGQPPTFGLFNKTTTPTSGGGGLFGNNAAGQTTTPQQTGLFGNTFGQSTSQPANNTFGGGTGLFGGRPSAPAVGATSSAMQPLGISALGNTLGTSAPGGPVVGLQGLQASIAQPIAANLPIFSLLPTPSAPTLDTSTKKKANLFDSVRAPTSRSIAYQPVQTRLRGYTSTTTGSPSNNGLTLSLTTGKPNALSLSLTASPGKASNGSESFGSSLLKTDSRASFKKLVLDKKVDAADLLKRPTFNASLAIAAREKDAAATSSPSPPTLTLPSKDRGTAHAVDSQATTESPTLQEGDYSAEPSISALSKLGYEALAKVKGLVVKRMSYGEIQFLEPVDLTTLAKLSDLLGEQVRFDEMECSVYPDSDGIDKPPPGSGLNVRARITLLRCWPLDKATRQPIKDEKHPSAIKHLKRLKNMKDTMFESFDIAEGRWTFTVDHF